jgi:hypothetical protein
MRVTLPPFGVGITQFIRNSGCGEPLETNKFRFCPRFYMFISQSKKEKKITTLI